MRNRNRATTRYLITSLLTALALLVACNDEPLGPTLGSITIQLVATDPPPVAPAAETRDSAGPAALPPGVGEETPAGKPERLRGEQRDGAQNDSQQVEPPALSPRDAALFDGVSVQVAGPTTKSQNLTLEGSNWVGTITGLAVGSYTVTVQGTTAGAVTYYGQTASVTVTGGQNTTANVPWNTFQPSLGAVPVQSLRTQLSVSWGAITGATGYEFQWANNPAFSSPRTANVTGTSATAGPVADGGMHYVRVRASNSAVSNGAWSDPASFEVLTDTTSSGDNQTNAPDLGFAPTTGKTGLNILPSSDTDWFAIQACVLDTLVAEVRAARLSPASGLNSFLEIRSADGQTVIADNGDAVGTDSRIALVLGESAGYNIVVSGTASTVGYYELDIAVAAGPANTGSSCSIVNQIPTTITVSPAGAALSSIGSTQDFTVEVQDQQGWLISPNWYDVGWAALKPDVATAPAGPQPGTAPGTITAQRDGQVIIEADVSGLKGYAVLTVTAPGAAQANVFDTLPAPSGAFALGTWGASASDIWVSGAGPSLNSKALLHYDGASWTADPTIDGTASAPPGYVWRVWGSSATDIFAVGYQGDVLHYDGTWTVMVPENTLAPELFDVWGAAPTDVYVGGVNGVFHWNGAVWDTAYAAPDAFWEVWGTAADNIWAADRSFNLYHYDGSAWTLHSSTSAWITDMWGAGPDDIWACGDGIMAHWDGGSWSEEPAPINLCLGIWGTSSSDIYASSLGGELAHYDGTGWTYAGQNAMTGFYAQPWGTATDEVWLPGWGTIWRGHRGGSVTVSAPVDSAVIGVTTVTPTAVVRDGGGTLLNAPVYWASLDNGVATVNSSTGQVTGQSVGVVGIVGTALGGAADTVQIRVVMHPGNLVVFGDIDMLDPPGFDLTTYPGTSNRQLFTNVYSASNDGPRNSQGLVWLDFGRSRFGTRTIDSLKAVLTDAGYSYSVQVEGAGALTDIPSNVRAILLYAPNAPYTASEIATLKRFLLEGGHVIVHSDAATADTVNAFLADMGTGTVQSAAGTDGGFGATFTLGTAFTSGVAGVVYALTGVYTLGAGDEVIYYSRTAATTPVAVKSQPTLTSTPAPPAAAPAEFPVPDLLRERLRSRR